MNIKDFRLWIFLIILASCILFFVIQSTPRIILKGSETVILEIGDTYKEEGAEVKYIYKILHLPIQIENHVNKKKIGTYKIEYITTYKGKKIIKSRTVQIVDTKKPEITLQGEEKKIVCPGKQYQEEGYTAFDNYDQDLTEKVHRDVHHDKIVYTVIDSSSNKAKKTRTLVYEDKESPHIRLEGDTNITIYQNDTFKEPGYHAVDACDGDITKEVRVEGKVDTSTIGTYKLIYISEDSSGNESKTERSVSVVTKPINADKTIYLTFDDGPSASITPGILKILKEENVKATFFVINHSSTLDYLIKQEYTEGHTVGIHSYTHNYAKIYASTTAYFEDLYAMQDKIEKITGHKPTIIRFPGGSSNTVSRKYSNGIMTILTKQVQEKGFQYFDWNVGSGDSGDVHTKDAVYQNVVSHLTKKSNVVLMHDFEGNIKTLEALRDIIQYGKQNGYRFARIEIDTFPAHHGINN